MKRKWMMIGPTVAVAALAFADSGGMGGMSGRKMGGSGMFDIADHRSVFVTGLGMGGMMVGSGGLERGLSAIALAPGEEAVRIERTVPHSPQVKRELGLIARVVAKFAINAIRHNPAETEVRIGGRIWIERESENGTTFTFAIPQPQEMGRGEDQRETTREMEYQS